MFEGMTNHVPDVAVELERSPEMTRILTLIETLSFDLLKKEIVANPDLVNEQVVIDAVARKGAGAIQNYNFFVIKEFAQIFPNYLKHPDIQAALESKISTLMQMNDSTIIKSRVLTEFPDLLENPRIFQIVVDRLKELTVESVIKKMLGAYSEADQHRLVEAMSS